MTRRQRLPPEPPEMRADDIIAALRSEEIILSPYANAEDLPHIDARLTEIRNAIRRLRELSPDEPAA